MSEPTFTPSEEANNVISKPTETEEKPAVEQPNILNVKITDQNMALNVLVAFVDLAQKRGAYNLQESAKLWEALQFFIQKNA
jgi:hypothetical protein